MKSQAQHGGGSRRWKLHASSSVDGSSNPDNNSWSGFSPDDGAVGETGGGGDGGRGQRAQRSKRSLPGIGAWRRSSEPAVLGAGKGILSPPPPPPRSRVRQRPSSGSGGSNGGADGDRGDDDGGAKSWLPGGGRKAARERRGTDSDIGERAGAGAGGRDANSGGDEEFFETVAKVPPWMEGVEASADYEEMKPTLDVIKRTVLLAMLQQVGLLVSSAAATPRAGDSRGRGSCMSACVRVCLVCCAA